MNVTGGEWRKIAWIDIQGEGGPGAPFGVDNLRLQFIPEPSTLALMAGVGLLLPALTLQRAAQKRN